MSLKIFVGSRLVEDWCATAGSTRAYIGPVGHFGSFSGLTDLQLGFDYHSYGFFTGIDHAFEDWGIGADFDYRAISGDANGFTTHQVHGSIYRGLRFKSRSPAFVFSAIGNWSQTRLSYPYEEILPATSAVFGMAIRIP